MHGLAATEAVVHGLDPPSAPCVLVVRYLCRQFAMSAFRPFPLSAIDIPAARWCENPFSNHNPRESFPVRCRRSRPLPHLQSVLSTPQSTIGNRPSTIVSVPNRGTCASRRTPNQAKSSGNPDLFTLLIPFCARKKICETNPFDTHAKQNKVRTFSLGFSCSRSASIRVRTPLFQPPSADV